MTTRIEISYDDEGATVHVTDDTGRDQVKTVPRYPLSGSEAYVRFVDAFDALMADAPAPASTPRPQYQGLFRDPVT